ncbi:MAG: CRISPR-associated protein [Blastocatellia bacterium]|nr:CRISPR-associated protein [Blastocatellia bacterium]
MGWTANPICLRLLSPMHIGWRKSGNLQQTRPYVTGRVLWGSLTARLTRESGEADYGGVGTQVNEQLAFTYFYPSTKQDRVTLWPWKDKWDEFAWIYMGSYVSTSLEDGHSAEEGSLHETEFISPYTREGKPVYLVGYIFARDDCKLEWKEILSNLQFGGERGYGWGRVALIENNGSNPPDKCFEEFEFIGDQDRPTLKALANAKILAHTIPDGDSADGEIEPLVGRETNSEGKFGQSHSKAQICWKPGKTVSTGDNFSIGYKGIWKRVS